MRPRPTSAWETAALAALMLILAGGVFAFGAVTFTGRAWLAAGMALALVAVVALPKPPRSPFPLLLPGVAFVAWTWGHLIPLPAALIEALAPLTAWSRSLAGMNVAGPLSVAPWEVQQAAPLATLTLVWAWAMWRLLRTPRAQSMTAIAVVIIAALAACLGWAQHLFDAERIWFFLPIEGGETSQRFGPLVNPNHDATLFAVGAALAATLGIQQQRGGKGDGRPYLIASACLAASTFATGSQAGLLALLVAAGGAGLWLMAHSAQRRYLPAALGALVATVGGVVAYGPMRAARRMAELGGHDPAGVEQRLSLWHDTLAIFSRAPVVGTGAESFKWLHPLVKSNPAHLYFDQAHSDWLQALMEGGLVAGALILWAVFAAIRSLRRGAWVAHPRPSWALGFTVAASIPLIHALVDFPLHIPALALLTATLIPLALAAARPVDIEPPEPGRGRLALRLGAAAALIYVGWLGWAEPTAAHTADLRLDAQLDEPPPQGNIPLEAPAVGASDLDSADVAHASPLTLERLGALSHARARRDLDVAAGHLTRAQDLFHAARLVTPTNHRAARGQGWVRLYLGDLDGAGALLEQATELGPGDPDTWRLLARLRRLQRDDARAQAAYTEGLLVADRPRAAQIFNEIEIAWPEEPTAVFPDRAEIWLWYGDRHVAHGRWRKARDAMMGAYERAQADGAVASDVIAALVLCHLRLKEVDAARGLLSEAESRGAPETLLYRLKGDVLLSEGKAAEALAYFRKLRSIDASVTHEVRVLDALARLERWAGVEADGRRAAERLDSGEVTGPPYQVAEIYRLLALSLLRQGRPQEALLPLAAAVGANPGHSAAIVLLIEAHRELRDVDRAAEIAEDHLRAHPDDARVWVAQGALEVARGDVAAARQAYANALVVRPGFAPAQKALGALKQGVDTAPGSDDHEP